jgi:hypothetical protein
MRRGVEEEQEREGWPSAPLCSILPIDSGGQRGRRPHHRARSGPLTPAVLLPYWLDVAVRVLELPYLGRAQLITPPRWRLCPPPSAGRENKKSRASSPPLLSPSSMDGPRKPSANRFIEEITFRFFVTYEAMGAGFFDVPLVLLRTDTTYCKLIVKI